MLAKASYVWNPFVYALGHPRYNAIIFRCLNAGYPSPSISQSAKLQMKPAIRVPPSNALEGQVLEVTVTQVQDELTVDEIL